jgi:DNA-binding NarL/FixJ family response regulator
MTRNPNLPLGKTGSPIRVAVLTDDPLLRTGLVSLLAQTGDVEVVGLDGADVALWDAGPDSQRTLARLPELRTLRVPVLAAVADPTHAASVLAAGAKGIVLREQVGPGMHAALAAVRSGLTVIDNALASAVVPNRTNNGTSPATRKPPRGGIGDLTERERQVVQLLAEGLSNKLIADRLSISDHTAKFHVNGVMAKLGASTRTEAVVEAVRRGLVTL